MKFKQVLFAILAEQLEPLGDALADMPSHAVDAILLGASAALTRWRHHG